MDSINNPMELWGYGGTSLTEGMFWLGFPYLAELAQRTEYRRISETIAKDMTRRWFRLQATGEDDKTDKIAQLEECIKHHKLQEKFTLLALLDGFFGRGHLYIDTGDTGDVDLLKLPLPTDPRMITKGSLKGLRVVEPMWCYPHMFNANDPLRENFYLPPSWWVMGKEIHRTRLLPFIGREMPDMLKPAYSFAGLSLSQMAKPYVDNWLRTRQSVSDLIHSFSTPVMMTNMGAVLNSGATAQLKMRAALFNYMRDNNNLMVLNKDTEDFKNVSAPLGALDHLQAQSQEHMASAVGIPLVVLLGISPSGLNATSEGELQVWAQFIHAAQGSFFDAHLTTVLNVMQLHLFGEIDPSITHAWEPLRELSEEEELAAEKTQSDIDAAYVNMGVLSPDEIRQRLSGEADSPYQGLDLDTPAPPPPQQEMDPLGGAGGGPGGPAGGPGGPPGAGGAAPHGMGTSAPAGGSAGPVSSGPGAIGSAGGSAAAPNPNKGSKDEDNEAPELDETGMPVEKNRGHHVIRTQDPNAEIHVHMGRNDRAHIAMGADGSTMIGMDAFNPNQKRGQPENAGEFGPGGGGGAKPPSYVQAGEAGETGGRKVGRSTIHLHAEPANRLATPSSGEGVGMKAAAGVAAAQAVGIAKGFGAEDRHVIHQHFAALTPQQRQGAANKIRQTAKVLPKLLALHWREQKDNAVNTAGAARAMLHGQNPTPAQWKSVRSMVFQLAAVSAMGMMGGGHGAEHVETAHQALEFGNEWLQHAMGEHAMKLLVGVGRLGVGAVTAAAVGTSRARLKASSVHAGDELGSGISEQDMQLLQRFAQALAKSAETLDEPTALQLLQQRQQQAPPAQDAFVESDHPRGQPGNAGQFGAGGGGGKTEGGGESKAAATPKHGVTGLPEGKLTTEIQRLVDRGGYEMKAVKLKRGEFEGVDRYEVIITSKAPGNIKTINQGRRTEQYDPELAEIETLNADVPEIMRDIAVLKKGMPGRVPIERNPDHMYRGIDAEEYESYLHSGKIKSKSDYNLEGQEGLTYWSSDPRQAESYSNGFAPPDHKPTFEKPCYILVAKRVAPEHETRVKGTGETEIGVNRAVEQDEVLEVWRGKVASMNAGSYSITDHDGGFVAGSGSAPSPQVVWEKVAAPEHAQDKEWDESKVHRGQPDNAGQFGPGGFAGKAEEAPAPKAKAAKAGAPKDTPVPVHLPPSVSTEEPDDEDDEDGEEGEEPAAKKPKKPPPPPDTSARAHGAAFVSPSVAEHLGFSEATEGLHSERQRLLETASHEIDAALHISSQSHAAIGAWSDGAENSIMTEAEGGSWEELKLAVAMKASLANQKAALVFQDAADGDAMLYTFQAHGDVDSIHQQLLDDGVAFHTIVPTSDGATVYAADLDGGLEEAFERAADRYGNTPTFRRGRAEFIGTDSEDGTANEQRHQAQLAYKRIIEGSGVAGAEAIWKRVRPTYGQAFTVTEYDKTPTTEPLPGSAEGSHPALISSRRPSAVGIVEGDEYRRADLEGMKGDPETFETNMELLKNTNAYPNLRPEEVTDAEGDTPEEIRSNTAHKIARAAIDHAKANLRFLYERAPKDVRDQGPKWYQGAHDIAVAAAKKYDLPLQSAAGVYAALSPQKLWDHNVKLGDAVLDIYHNHRNDKFDEKMEAKAAEIWAKEQYKPLLDRIRGKTLAELQLPAEKAMWIRTYDEAHNPQTFHRLAPDGTELGTYYTLDGKPAKGGWQNTGRHLQRDHRD